MVKDQAEADEKLSLKQRTALGVGKGSLLHKIITSNCHFISTGSAAGGVAGLDSMRYNYDGKMICRNVESMAARERW